MDFSVSTVSYLLEDGLTKVCIFARDRNFKKVVFKVPYYPYFYVEKEKLDTVKGVLYREETDKGIALSDYVVRIDSRPYIGDFGHDVLKVVTKFPFIIRTMRDRLEDVTKRNIKEGDSVVTYEADVLFHLRYMIDRGLFTGFTYDGEYGLVNEVHSEDIIPKNVESRLKLCFLDIELLAKKTKELDDMTAPINVIGWYNSESKQFKQICGDDERSLLNEFLSECATEQYDLFVIFSELDVKAILKRMEKNGIDPSPMGFIGKTNVDRGKIMGSEVIDISRAYTNLVGEPMWLTLDHISEVELGITKFKLKTTFYDSWFTARDDLLKKNMEDVDCIVKLEDKIGVISNYLDIIRRTIGSNFEDAFVPNRIGDIMYLRMNNGKLVLQSRTPWSFTGLKYLGAIVHDAVPGIYNDVLILDWSELYPNIIESLNIGWNTFIDESMVRMYNDVTNVNGILYRKDIESWTTTAMKGLRIERARIKTLISEAKKTNNKSLQRALKYRSAAYKSIINAYYGAYGFAGTGDRGRSRPSRLYCAPIAESITVAGRDILTASMKAVENIGYKIVYGDTDSVFIQVKEGTQEEADMLQKAIITAVEEHVKKKWNPYTFSFSISMDKLFKRMILVAKKRYHGMDGDGAEEVKGLEIIRKDTAQITVDAEKEIGKMILTGKPLQEVNDKIKWYYNEVRFGRMPLDKVMVRGKNDKDEYYSYTNNLKAMLFGNAIMDQDIDFGERFYWVYIKGIRSKDGKIKTSQTVENIIVPKKPKITMPDKNSNKKKVKSPKPVIQMNLFGTKVDRVTLNLSTIAVKQPVLGDNVIIDWNKMSDRVIRTPLKKYCMILGIPLESLKILNTLTA